MLVAAPLYSLLGGAFMGSYPVTIKAPAVLEAQVHPIIFQWYKSAWVFLTGWLFVLANVICGRPIFFRFTWWAVVSAGAWIPSGLCTIAAVPRLGVGMCMVLSTGAGTVLSFLVFWLVLGEKMKSHGPPEHSYYLAPVYLACVVAGMTGLIAAPHIRVPHGSYGQVDAKESDDEGSQAKSRSNSSGGSQGIGVLLAVLAGVFSAVQFGVVTVGKQMAMRADGCEGRPADCSPILQEQFNVLGSWMASFGIGALIWTSMFTIIILSIENFLWGQSMPSFHFRITRVPGSIAGLCWALGAFFQTMAVVRGGNAVMMPANYAFQLVTSGSWGLIYYKEVRDRFRLGFWAFSALWTLVAMILLGREKAA